MQKITNHQLGYDENGKVVIESYAPEGENKYNGLNLLLKTIFGQSSSNKGINMLIEKTNPTYYKAGNELIERIVESEHVVDIAIAGNGASYTTYDLDNASIKDKGSGGIIFVDPNGSRTTKNVDLKNLKLIEEQAPSHIVLAHELIHADRAIRGVRISLDKYGEQNYIDREKKFFISMPVLKKEEHYKEELATVGLNYNYNSDITENDIRIEQNVRLRGIYGH